jgi:HlyD family secretion protein
MRRGRRGSANGRDRRGNAIASKKWFGRFTVRGVPMKAILTILILIGLAVGGGYYYTTRVAADPPASFRTTTVKRGDLSSTISATGTVEAEELVDVGAQCVGPIREFGIDPTDLAKFKRDNKRDPSPAEMKKLKRIDYGSTVLENTLLAQIDPVTYQAQVEQAQASLVRAQADLLQMKAKLIQAEQDWKRAQRLRPDRAAAENRPPPKPRLLR